MIEGYFWVYNFRSRDYFGLENFGKFFFEVGIFWVFRTDVSNIRVI